MLLVSVVISSNVPVTVLPCMLVMWLLLLVGVGVLVWLSSFQLRSLGGNGVGIHCLIELILVGLFLMVQRHTLRLGLCNVGVFSFLAMISVLLLSLVTTRSTQFLVILLLFR